MTDLGRRGVLGCLAVLTAIGVQGARADTTDLALMCDLTLGPALSAAARAFRAAAGVRVHVFPTAPGLIQPQLGRDVQIDIVVTQPAALDRLAGSGLLAGSTRSGIWRDRLVIAERDDAAGSGPFAVSELPAASGIDGGDMAERLGVAPANLVSAIDTEEVAFLLTSGAARSGLLFLTDVRADPRLRVVRPVEVAPPMFGAAVTKGANRPDPAAFVRFLDTPRAAKVLSDAGLEATA